MPSNNMPKKVTKPNLSTARCNCSGCYGGYWFAGLLQETQAQNSQSPFNWIAKSPKTRKGFFFGSTALDNFCHVNALREHRCLVNCHRIKYSLFYFYRIAPNGLHLSQQLRCTGELLSAVLGDEDCVLDSDTAELWQVNPRLNRHHIALFQNVLAVWA